MPTGKPHLRGRQWFDTPELYGWTRRAALQELGLSEAASEGRPIIGVRNSWSELTHCNAPPRLLAAPQSPAVARFSTPPLRVRVASR